MEKLHISKQAIVFGACIIKLFSAAINPVVQ